MFDPQVEKDQGMMEPTSRRRSWKTRGRRHGPEGCVPPCGDPAFRPSTYRLTDEDVVDLLATPIFVCTSSNPDPQLRGDVPFPSKDLCVFQIRHLHVSYGLLISSVGIMGVYDRQEIQMGVCFFTHSVGTWGRNLGRIILAGRTGQYKRRYRP